LLRHTLHSPAELHHLVGDLIYPTVSHNLANHQSLIASP